MVVGEIQLKGKIAVVTGGGSGKARRNSVIPLAMIH